MLVQTISEFKVKSSPQSLTAIPLSSPSVTSLNAAIPIEYDHRKPTNEFFKQSNLINFEPLNCSLNYSGNYSNYVACGLEGILKLSKLDFSIALKDPNLYENISSEIERSFLSEKKILLLDLDETLIHADFDEEFPSASYDTVINFKGDDEDISVGIFIRNGLHQFLEEVSKHFEIGIFTASRKEYADAVINYIDPSKNFIKFRLYRNNCINVNGASIKDMRIFKDIVKMEKIVIVDNSIYSFANQLSNGILINSFYNDRSDAELINVMSYLLTFISPAKDVREVNKQFFNFEDILKQLSEEVKNSTN